MLRPTNPLRPSGQSQAYKDRQTYLPPHVEQAMKEHLQQTMPDRLKQYQDENTYVPPQAEADISEHLQNTLPPHLKQYAGAYMQQRVIQPGGTENGVAAGSVVTPTAAQSTTQPAQDQPSQSLPAQPYAFITNPPPPPKQSILTSLPGSGSIITRIGLAAGSLLVLIIILAILKSFLSSGPNLTAFVYVVQDQQEIIHLVSNASQSLPTNSQNFAATAQVSLGSSQSAAISYLTGQHQKINAKQLDLKISTETDNQLAASVTSGTYNQTFQQIMQAELVTYEKDLQQAYNQDKGQKGRALLQDSYRQAKLLEIQLTTPSS